MIKYGYLRVSTAGQSHNRQIDALRPLCDELHIETASAVGKKRPVYRALVRRLRPGDSVVIMSIDRAYRSTLEALLEARKFERRGVSFKVVNLNMDTATPEGMYMFQIQAAAFEFERAFLVKRTREGLTAARRRGVRLGRPPKLTPLQLDEARCRLCVPGTTLSAIAAEFNVWPWTLSRALRRPRLATFEEEPNR